MQIFDFNEMTCDFVSIRGDCTALAPVRCVSASRKHAIFVALHAHLQHSFVQTYRLASMKDAADLR